MEGCLLKNKCCFILILFVLIVFNVSTVYADQVNPESLLFIQDYHSSISVTSKGYIAVAGWTRTSSVVEEIKVTLYLQYWNGSRWVDYISWTNTKTNTTYVFIGGTLRSGIDANLAQGHPVTMVGKATKGTTGTVQSISYSFLNLYRLYCCKLQ